MNLRLKIDLNKLDMTAVYEAQSGARYIDLTLWENRDGPGKYGDSHVIKQDLGRERREKGDKSPIVGNGKPIGTQQTHQQSRPAPQRRPAPPTQTHTLLNEDIDNPPF